ncbi:MAG: hypothetical protein ABIH76_05995 [Candidatus Bathyarchaeota archaeon]
MKYRGWERSVWGNSLIPSPFRHNREKMIVNFEKWKTVNVKTGREKEKNRGLTLPHGTVLMF